MSYLSFLKSAKIRAADLARACGVNKSTVARWRRVPAERVLEVERVTGISRHEMRPDIYPPPVDGFGLDKGDAT